MYLSVCVCTVHKVNFCGTRASRQGYVGLEWQASMRSFKDIGQGLRVGTREAEESGILVFDMRRGGYQYLSTYLRHTRPLTHVHKCKSLLRSLGMKFFASGEPRTLHMC